MEPKGCKPPEGMGGPSMVKQMMEKMCCRGELDLAATCRAMMASAGKEEDTAPAPPVADEVLAVLKARGPLDLATLARVLKISPQGVLHLLGKLVGDGKATIIQATGGQQPGR